jgi:Domain of unknown function (DUF1707)
MGGTTGDGEPDAGIRASDAERDATIERLSAATGDGRLTLQEFSQRISARTPWSAESGSAAANRPNGQGRIGGPASDCCGIGPLPCNIPVRQAGYRPGPRPA